MNIYTSDAVPFHFLESKFLAKGYARQNVQPSYKTIEGRTFVHVCNFASLLSLCARILVLVKLIFETLFSLGFCWLSRRVKYDNDSLHAGRKQIAVYCSEKELHIQKVLQAYREERESLFRIEESVFKDRAFWQGAVAIDGIALVNAPDAIRADREIALTAVKSNSNAFMFLPDALRRDKEIVLLAVKGCGANLIVASDSLKNDRDVVTAAVTNMGPTLRFASQELQTDANLQKLALISDSQMTEVYPKLLEDPEIRKAHGLPNIQRQISPAFPTDAVQNEYLDQIKTNCDVLESCPIQLISDFAFMEKAIILNAESYRYASEKLKKDRALAMLAAKNYMLLLVHAPVEIRDDKEIVLMSLEKSGELLNFVSDRLKNDWDVVLKAVSKSGRAIAWASAEMKGTWKILFTALNDVPELVFYASDKLRSDKSIIHQVGAEYFPFASEDIRDDSDFVLQMILDNPSVLCTASPRLKKDLHFGLKAVKMNGESLSLLHDDCKDDMLIVREAVKQSPKEFKYASNRLKNDKVFVASLNLPNEIN